MTALRPPLSVVVPFLGSEPELETLAGRLAGLARRPDDELIVADNRVCGVPERTLGPVVVCAAGGVRSPGFARNRGAARAHGDWLVFLDADTEPAADLLDAYFTPSPGEEVAVLAGAINDIAAGPGVSPRHAVARGHMEQGVTLDRPAFPYAQTANCAVHRARFVACGGFEEGIRAAEDADLCFRLLAAGWSLESRPNAVAGHRTRATFGGSMRQLARHGSGAGWCNRRHPGSFPPPGPAALAARIGRPAWRAASAYLHGEREQAAFAALDAAGAVAFEFGRLLSNRARR